MIQYYEFKSKQSLYDELLTTGFSPKDNFRRMNISFKKRDEIIDIVNQYTDNSLLNNYLIEKSSYVESTAVLFTALDECVRSESESFTFLTKETLLKEAQLEHLTGKKIRYADPEPFVYFTTLIGAFVGNHFDAPWIGAFCGFTLPIVATGIINSHIQKNLYARLDYINDVINLTKDFPAAVKQ